MPTRIFLLLFTFFMSMATTAENLPPRPQFDEYDNEEAFVKDVLAWERRKRELKARTGAHNDKPENSQSSSDWHHVTGPEELDEALHNAYGYVQPNYKEKYRFNRTTHLSFPLERLTSGQLSRSAIKGGITDLHEQQRSLEPLPELRIIIDETSQALGQGSSKTPVEQGVASGNSPGDSLRTEVSLR